MASAEWPCLGKAERHCADESHKRDDQQQYSNHPYIARNRPRHMLHSSHEECMFKRVQILVLLSSAIIYCGVPGSLCHAAVAPPSKPAKSAEARAAAGMEQARRDGPLALYTFLRGMPKGADLHMHLSGAIYAETFIRDGADDSLCVNTTTFAFATPETTHNGPLPASSHPICGDGTFSVATAFKDQSLYDHMVDAFSMRSFVPSSGESAHDHFFATFGKFSGTAASHMGEWLDEVAARAAAQNEQYLEIMQTPPFSHAIAAAAKVGWIDDPARMRDELLAAGLRDDIPAARAALDAAEAKRNEREHCGTQQPAPACAVKIRFLYQVLRAQPRERVFAQTLLAFETIAADPRFVGLNFVQPEDAYLAMTDYTLQMHMLDALHAQYPKTHISLHAGELAPGLVPPDDLRFHIREAVELGHAERIGHGVDVMYENRPHELLRELADRNVLIEINLTSNDVILGIAGRDHPLPLYRQFSVPLALSTDDEGVSRIDLTHEYVRAATTYDLKYPDLKAMARASIEHSFLPGTSLWQKSSEKSETSGVPVLACKVSSSSACEAFLKGSEKAALQMQLEREFVRFESSF
jgi:adenosine deaminase